MDRKTIEEWTMDLAHSVASRGTCDRARVGAVILDTKNRIVATGYNGSAGPGVGHCDDIGHQMRDNHCIATVHAEQNAIADCARTGKAIEGCSIYVTHFPCLNCIKLIIQSGITAVYYDDDYRVDTYGLELLELNQVKITQVRCSK